MAALWIERDETAVQLSLEEKASLDEMIKKAELSLDSEDDLNQIIAVAKTECPDTAAAVKLSFSVTAVVGALMNRTGEPLTVMAKNQYAGNVVKGFPDPLYVTGSFAMGAVSAAGVMAAVVYSGKNKAGVGFGLLVGFLAYKDTSKIYVECGPRDNYAHIDWAVVKKNIVETKSAKLRRCHDPKTGTSIYATIVGTKGKYAVAAGFLA